MPRMKARSCVIIMNEHHGATILVCTRMDQCLTLSCLAKSLTPFEAAKPLAAPAGTQISCHADQSRKISGDHSPFSGQLDPYQHCQTTRPTLAYICYAIREQSREPLDEFPTLASGLLTLWRSLATD